MNKKSLIIANWKMNPSSFKDAKRLFETIEKETKKIENIETVFCPPFVYLSLLSQKITYLRSKSLLKLGAQNCFFEEKGAFTGEVSPLMLKNMDCEYVIVGHSERRKYLGEDDEMINKKTKAAIKAHLNPILCVGEQEKDSHESSQNGFLGGLSSIVKDQLEKGLKEVSAVAVKDVVIAYEPVWAIGTGNSCLPDDAMRANLFIRKTMTNLYSRKTAEKVKILYGGSVTSQNADSYIKEAGMDGLLVGGASLNASEFIRILKKISAVDL